MADQNFLALGLDVSSFTPDKASRLNEFLVLFEKLDKYSALSINPVAGPGLVEFNQVMTQTSTLLTDINEKLKAFNTTTGNAANTTKSNARSTKELTKEQAELKIKLQETNKLLLDQAKASNASVQARLAAIKAANDQKKADADAAAATKKAEADRQAAIKKTAADRKKADTEAEAARRKKIALDKEAAAADAAVVRTEMEEDKITQKLISDYELLKQAQRDQATNYANLYIAKGGKAGGSNEAAATALAEYKATSTVINNIETNLANASGKAKLFGGALSGAFSQLRTIAYILPGIGIAGIFNLAFEAIGKAVEELGLFSNKTEKYLDLQNAINKSLLETIQLNEKLYALDVKLQEDRNGTLTNKQKDEINQARGVASVQLANERRNLAEDEMQKATASIIARGNSPEVMKSDLERRLRILNDYSKQIETIQKKLDVLNNPKNQEKAVDETGRRRDVQGAKTTLPKKTILEKEKENLEGLKKIEEEKYNVDKDLQDKYLASQSEFFLAEADLAKKNEDELRSIKINKRKETFASEEDLQKRILEKEISSEQDRVKALKKAADDERQLSLTDLYNVVGNEKLGIPKDLSANPSDIAAAVEKNAKQQIKITRELNDNVAALEESYRQRRLTAEEQIEKDEIEKNAIAQERIYKNEQKTLAERLDAYIKYVGLKQQIQDVEYKRDIDVLSLKADDPTVRKEIEAKDKERLSQQANIQADVEKQVYDIIYTSTQKKLKLVSDENKANEETNKRYYTEALENLNKSFADKNISYTKYKKKRKEIDYTYGKESLDATIKDDENSFHRSEALLKEELTSFAESMKNLDIAKNNLDFSKASGIGVPDAQKQYDKALGAYEGYQTAVQNADLQTRAAQKKMEEDKFKRAKLMPEEDIKNRQRYLQAIRQIENQIYQTVKSLGDQEYQYRLDLLQKTKAVIDEQYDHEISAIDKSSLYAKDKQALDIQLNEQKRQYDRETAKEERRIKHDQAVFDRDIAIAHIILSTAEAIAATIEFPVLAIAAGVAGAAELAVATNVRIPSYAKGSQGLQEGHVARYGEAGWEMITEPYKSPYLVMDETVGYLPKGTQITPIRDMPDLQETHVKDEGWQQVKYLAQQFKKNVPKTNVVNNINIDLGFQSYKRQIIGN